jgi:type IV secretory pathway VirJ component
LSGVSTLIVSESHGFHGTVLLIGTGTVVDDLAAELVGGELELERGPREQAVALIQLVAPDLLVLAADCATDGGLAVLGALADAGVTTDVRVLVVCESGFKASGAQSAFRHVVRLPPQGGAKSCATRIKAVLARLTQNGSQQEALQRIVDAVCGTKAKPTIVGAAAQSASPTGAFSARAPSMVAHASPAKPPAKTAQLNSSVSKLATDTKQRATAAQLAGKATSPLNKLAPLETSRVASTLTAAKPAAETLPLSVFSKLQARRRNPPTLLDCRRLQRQT